MSGAPPTLSILVVNWNTREILRDCLRSVDENRAGLDLEVILVDNDSRDGSPEMVEADFPWVRLVRNDRNRGFAAANNQALAMARGRFLLLLNSDTVVLGDVLARCVRYLETHPDVGALGCRVLNPDRTMQATCSRFPSFGNLLLQTTGLSRLPWPRWLGRYEMTHWDRDDERDVEVISGCFLMLPRAVYERVGGLDERFFFFGEETDWCRRIADTGLRLRFANVGEIVHLGSASARKLDARRDLLLTRSLVRVNRQHHGTGAAAAVWALLFGFNASRWLYWSIRSRLSRDEASQARRRHFAGVLRAYRESWPASAGDGDVSVVRPARTES